MFLFILLSIILIALLILTVLALSAGGVLFILIFGDFIVFAIIVLAIMKRTLFKKKNKKK